MEYSGTRLSQGLQSPAANLSAENSQSCGDSSSSTSNEAQVLSPTQYGVYEDKHSRQYQSQSPSLNQLLQSSQCGQYGLLRPPVSSNYWNVPRQQNETSRQYYTNYEEGYTRRGEDVACPKTDRLKSGSDVLESVLYKNDDCDKSRPALQNWKVNDAKSDTLSPEEIEKKVENTNSVVMSDGVSLKPELSHLNTDYNSSTQSSERREKNDVMYQNSNYPLDNKIGQSQFRQASQVGYENVNYGQMMAHPGANYYSQMRYPSPQNNAHNYTHTGNNPMLPVMAGRPPVGNYPPYMQTSSPVPGYPQMSMQQPCQPYNIQAPYTPRGPQAPFSGHSEVYMNGSLRPQLGASLKEAADRKEDASSVVKQEASDSVSSSNKSAAVRSSSKSKNVTKSESHPTTPISNTAPSPSQTSVSSIVDDNEDSVSSHGPNEASSMHHPMSQFNQRPTTPNMSPNLSMIYPQQFPHNNQIPQPNIGAYPGHLGPQQPRPFAPSPNVMPGRQYHQQNDSQINNSCFPKLLELGTEPERGPWVERYLKFMQENNTPLSAVPTVVKQPLDLFRLYHAVRDRGGLLNVVKTKRWKEICNVVNVNASASGAYTLRRNYIKCLLDFECRFDRNGVDPGPILQEIQSLSDKKKKSITKTSGSSSSSTISTGITSQHNTEFGGNQSTPRPLLPPSDFNSSHSFPGQNAYNNPVHNGAPIHRNPTQYPTQRIPYPNPFLGPRMMGAFSTPPSSMYPQVRYDSNMPPNWSKPTTMNQQQWSSPSSSSNSNSTHPMQMPVSPGTSSNSVSNSSQQSQQAGDDFEANSKDGPKIESSLTRYANSDNVAKTSDSFTDKDIDKVETSSKSDTNYYNHPYSGYPGPDGSFEYFQHGKNLPSNVNPPFPPVQYPGFPFSRQYGSSFRQSANPSHLSYSSYYPTNSNYVYPPGSISNSSTIGSNSHPVTNSTSSHSPYYPIGSLQEHSRRMDWKSNYGGMPPPPPPPPNGQASTRGPLPPNITNSSQPGTHSQHHSSMLHCNYQNQTSTSLNKQRPINPQLSSSMMLQNRHLVQSPSSHQFDQANKSSMATITASASANSGHGMSYSSCHNRSQIDTARQTQPYSSQSTYSKSGATSFIKRYDQLFPRHCVEVAQPDYSKKRKYSGKDLKPFNPVTVTMALKSGLVAEVSLALNCLNIWSRDDSCVDKLSLKGAMSMFHALVDVWRHSLGTVFGGDLFIEDLELPVSLGEDDCGADLVHVLASLGVQVAHDIVVKEEARPVIPPSAKNGSTEAAHHSIGDLDDRVASIEDSIVEMLDSCVPSVAASNAAGDSVKLEMEVERNGYCGDEGRALIGRVVGSLNSRRNGVSGIKEEGFTDLQKKIRGVVERGALALPHRGRNGSVSVSNGLLGGCRDKLWAKVEDIVEVRDKSERASAEGFLHGVARSASENMRAPVEEGCARYEAVRSGFTVQSGAECVSGGPGALAGVVEAVLGLSCGARQYKGPRLRTLWEEGWSDTSMHILPPVLSQAKRARPDSPEHCLHDSREIESLFFGVTDAEEERMLRCICVSMVIRNLSFVSGNDRIMGSSRPLLVLIGRLLLLGHEHDCGPRPWWARWIEDVREHVLVTLVNLASHLKLDTLPERIVRPLVAGLLHWLTCQSAEAVDPLPSHRVLGCRRLALECLMRLCVHERNIDFVVCAGGGADTTVRDLFNYLASSFCYPDVQVVKEMALAVMHYLSAGGDDALGCLYLAAAEPSVIGGLISFIEATESQIRHVVENMGMEALQARPELMGTSLEFLRHSGALLARIAGSELNRARFSRDHEIRMLNLVISTVLDQTVAQSISAVLFLLSSHDDNSPHGPPDKFKSFLTFDDLGFCEAEVSVGSTSSELLGQS